MRAFLQNFLKKREKEGERRTSGQVPCESSRSRLRGGVRFARGPWQSPSRKSSIKDTPPAMP